VSLDGKLKKSKSPTIAVSTAAAATTTSAASLTAIDTQLSHPIDSLDTGSRRKRKRVARRWIVNTLPRAQSPTSNSNPDEQSERYPEPGAVGNPFLSSDSSNHTTSSLQMEHRSQDLALLGQLPKFEIPMPLNQPFDVLDSQTRFLFQHC
jgi:hypothetical protein